MAFLCSDFRKIELILLDDVKCFHTVAVASGHHLDNGYLLYLHGTAGRICRTVILTETAAQLLRYARIC